ncbi:citryl-CoA lyase [Agaricicola taiwanensis]|uniref:Citryl-CoA lyase n=1 Tax=Agaricicola taiwanensis TaxID=591372 RepID=A0A8J2YJW8_9RHOB|nr:CoA ester lyase [Agaricicola taiwanensis]GGE47676.1 citryl-CoA lyase [Agaricicola taiwanensis]
MRSLLFVPGDSPHKLARALESGADALIIDLEDSVAPAAKAEARATAAAFIDEARRFDERIGLWVRINAFGTGLADDDLAAVVPAEPNGILLPKSTGGFDVTDLHNRLAVEEAKAGIDDGALAIIVIATETAGSIFGLGSYPNASPRLTGLAWGAEDLAAAISAETNRFADRSHTPPFRLARELALFAAVAASVAPIDTVFTAYKDLDGLRQEAEAARRDGFTGKLAVHPAQVPVINQVFMPNAEAVARARAVVAAFEANPGAGVVGLDGQILDRPHLIRAQGLLARAKTAGVA